MSSTDVDPAAREGNQITPSFTKLENIPESFNDFFFSVFRDEASQIGIFSLFAGASVFFGQFGVCCIKIESSLWNL